MRTLIAIPVFNRLRVAELCLASVYRNRGNAVVHVYNDHSTEFEGAVLAPYCDELFELPPPPTPIMESNPQGRGIHHLRWHQFRDFLRRPEFDHLYFADSDALHDPRFMEVLEVLVRMMDANGERIPVCLYNSAFHAIPFNQICGNGEILIRKKAPGISHLYNREMVEIIVRELDRMGGDPNYHWDFIAPAFLNRPFLTTGTSYVEHLGAVPGSIHTEAGDWNRDRAVNPTPYLAAARQPAIDYLEGRAAVFDDRVVA
ncbi:MAG TPA: glycosyltransferase family A protein [Opitutaceae bacterium]|nr:glycosyltransferase family A protein [Opitutaceae bacterium]